MGVLTTEAQNLPGLAKPRNLVVDLITISDGTPTEIVPAPPAGLFRSFGLLNQDNLGPAAIIVFNDGGDPADVELRVGSGAGPRLRIMDGVTDGFNERFDTYFLIDQPIYLTKTAGTRVRVQVAYHDVEGDFGFNFVSLVDTSPTVLVPAPPSGKIHKVLSADKGSNQMASSLIVFNDDDVFHNWDFLIDDSAAGASLRAAGQGTAAESFVDPDSPFVMNSDQSFQVQMQEAVNTSPPTAFVSYAILDEAA